MVPDEPATLGGAVAGLCAEDHRERVGIRDDHVPAGPYHPREFPRGRAEVGAVRERERADGEVHRAVGQRKRREVAGLEARCGNLRSRVLQHLGSGVDTDHPVTCCRQVFGVAAGAAGRVERIAGRVARHHLMHDRLLGEQHRVVRGVVDGGPLGIPVRDRPFAHDDGTRPRLLVESARHLDDAPDPRLDARRVQRPCAHDAEALETEDEIAERGVIGHGKRLPGAHQHNNIWSPLPQREGGPGRSGEDPGRPASAASRARTCGPTTPISTPIGAMNRKIPPMT